MLKPYAALDRKILNMMASLKLSKYETNQIIQTALDKMTYDKTEKLMEGISESYLRKASLEDKEDIRLMFLWNVRMSYVTGFADAIECYSTAIDHSLRQSIRNARYENRRKYLHLKKTKRRKRQVSPLTPKIWAARKGSDSIA